MNSEMRDQVFFVVDAADAAASDVCGDRPF